MTSGDKEIGVRLSMAINAFLGPRRQQVFAKLVGVSPSRVTDYIKGRRRIPQEVFIWFAENTDIRVEWILTGDEPMWKPIDYGQTRQDAEELAKRASVVSYKGEEFTFQEVVRLIEMARDARTMGQGKGEGNTK